MIVSRRASMGRRHPLNRRRGLSVAVPLVVGLWACPSSTLAADQPVLGVHPQNQESPDAHGHFRYDVQPGMVIHDGLVVQNFSDTTMQVDVYPADLLQAQGGGFAPAQKGQPMHEVGAWIVFDKASITIPPRQQLVDPFTLTVPNPVDPGQHLGAVVAAANVSKSGGVTIQGRTALITEVVVPGLANPQAAVGPLAVTHDNDGSLTFKVGVTNTGNVLLAIDGSVVVRDSSGRTVTSVPLVPSKSYAFPKGTALDLQSSQPWTPPAGDFTFQAVAKAYSNDKLVGTYSDSPLSLTFVNWVRVWISLAVLLLVLVVAAIATRRWLARRRRARAVAEEQKREEEARAKAVRRLTEI